MQAASDKTFHLKWNNHLQNLSQLFTAIYSSSALADVTLACRDGTLRAHKLVLSACSPYFEQIFKDNPCKHPVVILKGIPFQEINLLVEFMYKGSVDVQELDLQSLMHTASELEIRGLAYEVRANAAQLLNVNLEYPAYSTPAVTVASTSPYETSPRSLPRTDMERLKQIHMYQQSMLREAELAKRKRRDEPMPTNTTAAVKSILAAAAKELADGTRERTTSCAQTEDGETTVKTELFHAEEETWSRPKKRVSIFTPEEEKARRRKMQYVVKQSPQHDGHDDGLSKLRISAVMGADAKPPETPTSSGGGGIKVVNLSALQQPGPAADQPSDDEESSLLQERGHQGASLGEDEESCSSGSASESAHDAVRDTRPHVCDICDIRFQRASHLNRHRLTHTGERPFTCGGCGKSFARSDKLRVHTKICERDDPTVDMADDGKCEATGEVMSGTVRITHRDSRQLMFTPSGDVMLAPRALSSAPPHQPDAAVKNELTKPDSETPTKRGRGRPKKPVPDVPKIKKRRGRPPKALSDLDLMIGLGNGGLNVGAGVSGFSYEAVAAAAGAAAAAAAAAGAGAASGGGGTVPMQQHITPSGQQLIVKRKRGRPPKNFFQPLAGARLPESYYDGNFTRDYKPYGRPKENYNATNLPFGDFSYLTEMINYPGGPAYAHPYHSVTTVDPEQDVDMDTAPGAAPAPSHNQSDPSHHPHHDDSHHDDTPRRRSDRTIDLSSSSSDDGTEDSRADHMLEGDDNVPAAICETEIMTVGDCQILKLPPGGGGEEPPRANQDAAGAPSENGKLSITAITNIGDCTIRPVDADEPSAPAHQ